MISVCMVTYNKKPFLERSIPAIFSSLDPSRSFEFFVWNNASTDGTAEYLNTVVAPDNVRYMSFDGKRNIGLNAYSYLAKFSTGDIVVTVDDDIFSVTPGWEEMLEIVFATKFDGRVFGYVGTDTVNADGGRIYEKVGVANVGELEIEIGPVGGWFAATTQHVMEKVGGFHVGMPELHLEDLDYQQRVWNNGYLCGTLTNVQVYHARSPRFYKELGCEDTYIEKQRLAAKSGIRLEPLT